MKRLGIAIAVLLIVVLGAAGVIAAARRAPTPHPLKGRVVVIDAGHGGLDGGAIGRISGVREDDINLAVARELKTLFEEAGVSAVMTREDRDALCDADTKLSLQKRQDMQRRAKIIKEAGADYVISIHMNSFSSPKQKGATVLYQSKSQEGKALAQDILAVLKENLDDGNRRDVISGNYLVLRSANVPSALIECGFLSNPEEEELLQQVPYQKKLAWCILTGIMRYDAKTRTENESAPQPTPAGQTLSPLPSSER